jgi:nucleoside-diphosphate-sugar epimerase
LRVLVTGGAGFVGSHLVQALVKEGHRVRVLDDFSGGVIENLYGHEVVKGSVVSSEIMNYACKDMDLIYNLAALINVDESLMFPELFHQVNATGTLNLLKAAQCPVIHLSTSEVYGSAEHSPMDERHSLKPQSPYASSKLAAEMHVTSFEKSYGTKAVIVRAFNQYGPRQKGNVNYGGVIAKNIIRVLSGQPPIVRGGEQRRDYLYVEDTVRALIDVANADVWGEIINLGAGYSLSVNEIIGKILTFTGSDLEPVHEVPRRGDVQDLVCDSSKAERLLGWKPKVTFTNGLWWTIEWFKANQERARRYIFPNFVQELKAEPYSTMPEIAVSEGDRS